MRRRLSRLSVIVASSLVIIIGLVTLFGLLLGDVQTAAGTAPTGLLSRFFVQLATVTLALTLIIGVFNLLFVNSLRTVGLLRRRTTISAALASIALLASFFVAIYFYYTDRDTSMFLLEEVQVPIESALAGLLFFALVYGAFNALRKRVTLPRILFVVTIIIVLLGSLTFPGYPVFAQIAEWVLRVPVVGGARGILLGIALATLVVGVRILIGQDRTYGE